ncbi:MAG: hypothetical protein JNM61_13240 [Zoogloeaceae bacterium]|nr:hypothetical protein [Zoogloeaceae bacterium]
MQIQLVIPGLLWPASQGRHPAQDLALPALSRLIGHAQVDHSAPLAPDLWLANRFGLTPESAPLAALRRLGEDGLEPMRPGSAWLCADPVNLHFAREHLLLADAGDLALTENEADALTASLNETFSDLGRFEAGAPDRWYLQLATVPQARFFPLTDVTSRPVGHFLPEGPDAAQWARAMNEAQIILHNHPVSAVRESSGRATANSIWFWGAGPLPAEGLAPPAPRILAEGLVARGLARAAGVEPGRPAFPESGPDTLIVLEDLLRPALYLDIDGWSAALQGLEERWFAPLLAGLKSRRIARLQLAAPGDRATLSLGVEAGELWKFWRKPRGIETLGSGVESP